MLVCLKVWVQGALLPAAAGVLEDASATAQARCWCCWCCAAGADPLSHYPHTARLLYTPLSTHCRYKDLVDDEEQERLDKVLPWTLLHCFL